MVDGLCAEKSDVLHDSSLDSSQMLEHEDPAKERRARASFVAHDAEITEELKAPPAEGAAKKEDEKKEKIHDDRTFYADPDIPDWCRNRWWIARKLSTPKECEGLKAKGRMKPDEPVETFTEDEEKKMQSRRPNEQRRDALWVCLSILAFAGVVGLALALPYCFRKKGPGVEYFAQDPATQAYVDGDQGYAQQMAYEQQAGYQQGGYAQQAAYGQQVAYDQAAYEQAAYEQAAYAQQQYTQQQYGQQGYPGQY